MAHGSDAPGRDLYTASPEEFTSRRAALVRELKAQGSPAWKAVQALKKPTLVAWALNQVARSHGDDIDRLYEAAERMARAQGALLRGGKAEALREAVAEERAIVGRLADAADAVIAATHPSASASVRRQISETLHAAATSEQGRRLLRLGMLTGPLTGDGSLEQFLAQAPGRDEKHGRPKAARPEPQVAKKGAAGASKESAAKAHASRRALRAAEGALAKQVRASERARRQREAMAGRIRQAEAEVARVDAAAAAAAARAKRAQADLEALRADAEQAAAEERELEAKLEALRDAVREAQKAAEAVGKGAHGRR